MKPRWYCLVALLVLLFATLTTRNAAAIDEPAKPSSPQKPKIPELMGFFKDEWLTSRPPSFSDNGNLGWIGRMGFGAGSYNDMRAYVSMDVAAVKSTAGQGTLFMANQYSFIGAISLRGLMPETFFLTAPIGLHFFNNWNDDYIFHFGAFKASYGAEINSVTTWYELQLKWIVFNPFGVTLAEKIDDEKMTLKLDLYDTLSAQLLTTALNPLSLRLRGGTYHFLPARFKSPMLNHTFQQDRFYYADFFAGARIPGVKLTLGAGMTRVMNHVDDANVFFLTGSRALEFAHNALYLEVNYGM